MTKRKRERERGFTLIEMLVVVAIIGILATIAAVSLTPRTKPIDTAERIGDLVREANRRAVALGPVRANVSIALGHKARTRVIGSGTSPQPIFIMQRLEEDPTVTSSAANWVEVTRYTVDGAVIANSWDSGVNTKTALDPTRTDWDQLETKCYPDGTCDPITVFYEATNAEAEYDQFARMSVMPLGGAIMTRKEWN